VFGSGRRQGDDPEHDVSADHRDVDEQDGGSSAVIGSMTSIHHVSVDH
jgi:hypothetical protein